MLSAVMLSWMFGAVRFVSIARICEARTPTTSTTDKVLESSGFPGSAFLGGLFSSGALGEAFGPDALCVCGSGAAAASPVGDAAMADVAIAANSDMDMANDSGCLRYAVGMDFTPLIVSVGTNWPARLTTCVRRRRSLCGHAPCGWKRVGRGLHAIVLGKPGVKCSSCFVSRKRDSRERPLTVARIARGDDAYVVAAGGRRLRDVRSELALADRSRRKRHRGDHGTFAGVEMNREFAVGRAAR